MSNLSFDIIEIKKWFYRAFKSYYSVVAVFIIIFFFLPDIKLPNPVFYIFDLHTWIRIFLFASYLLVFAIKKFTLLFLRRKSRNKTGIAFRIVSSTIDDYSLVKNKFFKKLRNDLSDNDFDLYLVNYDDYIKMRKKEEKVFNRLGLCLVLDINEREGKSNSIQKYGFNIEYYHFMLPTNKDNIERLIKNDLLNSMTNIVEIEENNEYDDFRNYSEVLEAGIEYMLSIFYIVFNKGKKALQSVEKVKTIIENCQNQNNEKILYIRNNLPLRLIEASYCKIANIDLIKNNYDQKTAEKYLEILKNFKNVLDNQKTLINGKNYSYFNNEYLGKLLLCHYVLGDKEKIDEIFEEIDKDLSNYDLTIQFDKAFILATKGYYSKSYNMYYKLFRARQNGNVKKESFNKKVLAQYQIML